MPNKNGLNKWEACELSHRNTPFTIQSLLLFVRVLDMTGVSFVWWTFCHVYFITHDIHAPHNEALLFNSHKCLILFLMLFYGLRKKQTSCGHVQTKMLGERPCWLLIAFEVMQTLAICHIFLASKTALGINVQNFLIPSKSYSINLKGI